MSYELNKLVKETLAQYTEKVEEDIIIVSNKDKYYDKISPIDATDYSDKIFSLMKNLNKTGLEDELIGVLSNGNSFKDALSHTIHDMSNFLEERLFSYVELGPEPIKTLFILSSLLKNGYKIESYTSIDINPSSETVMREALSALIPEEKINFINSDYANCTANDIPSNGANKIVTMLGFQEGNEDPKAILDILDNITAPKDIVLSEMQMISEYNFTPIFDFYNSSNMVEFSSVVFKQIFSALDSVHGVFLLPITINSFRCFVAITTETITSYGEYFNKIFITNYCLKFSPNQYTAIREERNLFTVFGSHCTEDQSVMFQLSQKTEV
jgi:hypothetical protein